MAKQVLDLTGMVYGKLTVLKRADDYILPSGQHQIMWQCQCECGNTKNIRSASLKNGKTNSCGCLHKEIVKKMGQNNKKNNQHVLSDCNTDKILNKQNSYNKKQNKKTSIKMSEQEKEEFDELYEYVKCRVMGYDKNQSLSRTMVLRLKGLKVNKYIENKNIKDTANYPYSIILATFKYSILDIEKSFRIKSFNNEITKFSYAMAIVENNLNTVYKKIKATEKQKDEIESINVLPMANINIKKNKIEKEIENKYDCLW